MKQKTTGIGKHYKFTPKKATPKEQNFDPSNLKSKRDIVTTSYVFYDKGKGKGRYSSSCVV